MTSKPSSKRPGPNRLLKTASPYLRQHAYNPIDWYEWGEEAFDKAEAENKPIFLSVGYSTCHWCHVMAHESFESEEIAEILNASFVAIKVDRERRPDVDETYMLATQLVTGQGGWPNSVFLTPGRKPFYAGTYYPRDTFRSLLIQVAGFWVSKGDDLRRDADKLSETIASIMTRRIEAAELTPERMTACADALMRTFDPVFGGFGGAPKFPQESVLLFLLRLAQKDGNAQALNTACATLDAILNGGIHDHAGGGFHRYAVDEKWLVPHFEKMLYNQAMIVQALVRAYVQTGRNRFAEGARRALDYVLDDLTDAGGGFYSARDADSEGEEGTFYVWTPGQIEAALGKEDAAFAIAAFGVTQQGNFEHATSVLHFPRPPEQLAKDLGLKVPEFNARLDAIRARLTEVRAGREAPHRDEKILTAWNGMMIVAFAEAARMLQDKRYEKAALKAGAFVWDKLRVKGKLRRTCFEGKAELDAQQEDFAFAALGFIALHDLTREADWLERAAKLLDEMVQQFRDDAAGDYFMSASTSTFARAKARADGGTPSGNSAALEAFALMSQRSPGPQHRINGEALLAAISGLAVQSPHANAYALMAADMMQRGGAGARQFMAQGAVDAHAVPASGELNVTLDIARGWHINSHAPLEDSFIATQLEVEGAGDVKIAYPEHETRKLGFHDGELAVYQGTVTLKAKLPKGTAGPLVARLRLQACSDQLCLEPETAEFRISDPGPSAT